MSQPHSEEGEVIEHVIPPALPERNEHPELPGLNDVIPPELAFATDASEAAEGAETGEALTVLGIARLRSVLESLLLVADRPLPLGRILEILQEAAELKPSGEIAGPPLYQPAEVQAALSALAADYRAAGRGIELHQVAGGWQLRTAPANAAWVQRLLQQKPTRLARAQLEVLAIVAYRQPITRPEIDDVRGVDSGGSLKTLLERRLVRILGKKEEPGRPLLYGTTREFLEFFNLRDLKDLPTLREYYDLSEEHKAQVRAAHGEAEAVVPSSEPLLDTMKAAPPPLSRVEIVEQQIVDDAEQLGKIDELISSVSTDFSALNEILTPNAPPAAEPAPPASAAPSDPSQLEEP